MTEGPGLYRLWVRSTPWLDRAGKFFSERDRHLLVLALDMACSEGGWMWNQLEGGSSQEGEIDRMYDLLDPDYKWHAKLPAAGKQA